MSIIGKIIQILVEIAMSIITIIFWVNESDIFLRVIIPSIIGGIALFWIVLIPFVFILRYNIFSFILENAEDQLITKKFTKVSLAIIFVISVISMGLLLYFSDKIIPSKPDPSTSLLMFSGLIFFHIFWIYSMISANKKKK
jgi:hypothetical protein